MSVTLPDLRIGDAVCHESLCVFPLFAESKMAPITSSATSKSRMSRLFLAVAHVLRCRTIRPDHRSVEYRLSDEALADQSVVVQEVSQAGSVPELFVENKGATCVSCSSKASC